jgi:hypothetical protein
LQAVAVFMIVSRLCLWLHRHLSTTFFNQVHEFSDFYMYVWAKLVRASFSPVLSDVYSYSAIRSSSTKAQLLNKQQNRNEQ